MEFRFIDPAADFSYGLKVLKSYHQEFLGRGRKLLTLADEIFEQGMNENLANRCVEMHCHYFHANPLHHLDEEHGLFPLIVDRSQLINGMIERLVLDHEEIEEEWNVLGALLARPNQITDVEQFRERAIAFEKIQREHVTREDEDFLPEVEQMLTPEQKKLAGSDMAKLRHLQIA